MLLSYSIISSIILIFGYLAFRFFLAGQCQHSFNRKMLLLIYACSLLIPIAVLASILHNPPNIASDLSTIGIEVISNNTSPDQNANSSEVISSFPISSLLQIIYVLGAVIAMCYFLYGVASLWQLVKKGQPQEFENFTIVLVDDTYRLSPFTWEQSIVMRKSDFEEDGDMILIHEHAHLRLHHWVDLVLAYLAICLQWYNPAAWAMRRDLKMLHEYQADEAVKDTGVNLKDYQMLLLEKAVGTGYQSFANNLNQSNLKKRITMMYKKKTSTKRRLFSLALIPAIGAGIAVTAIPSVAGVLESLATEAYFSPTAAASVQEKDNRDVFVAVETQAEYPGGMEALMHYLMNNIRYPEEAYKNDIQGRVIIKFVIEKDGAVTNAEVVKGVAPELDQEALRVVSSLPKWIPAKVGGKDVASYFTLPVNFRLQIDEPKE